MKKISQGIKKGIIGTGIFSGESNQFDFCSYIIFLSVFYNIIRFIIVYYFDSLFLYFAIGIIFGLGSGVTAIIAQFIGMKNKKRADNAAIFSCNVIGGCPTPHRNHNNYS